MHIHSEAMMAQSPTCKLQHICSCIVRDSKGLRVGSMILEIQCCESGWQDNPWEGQEGRPLGD